jgi:hypothetical protein
MKKFSKRYLKPEDWNFKGNLLVGTEWTVESSKAGNSYTIALTEKGFNCSCTGFHYYGKCKHSTEVIEKFND